MFRPPVLRYLLCLREVVISLKLIDRAYVHSGKIAFLISYKAVMGKYFSRRNFKTSQKTI